MDKDIRWARRIAHQKTAQALSPQRRVRMTRIAASCFVLVLIILGVLYATPGWIRWWQEASARQKHALSGLPSREGETKLFEEARRYTEFWEKRERRLAEATVRFGWNEKDLERATRSIEAARPHFQTVQIMFHAWGKPEVTYELLKKEVGGLYKQLTSTFCEEFNLVCKRGVPPHEAYFKPPAPHREPRTKTGARTFS